MANVKNYKEQGGKRDVIGGSLDIVDGGDLDVETGAELKIAGTALTPSAAEVNILKGVTADKDEINVLDGVVGGTLSASKAVVVDGQGKIDTFDPTQLKIGGTAISKTAAQINALPIVEQAAEADIAQADAADQGAGYVEADVDSIADLANVNKAKINDLLAKLRLANIIAE